MRNCLNRNRSAVLYRSWLRSVLVKSEAIVGQIKCKHGNQVECNFALSSVEEIDCFLYAQSWYCKPRD